jgi:O-antigen ligase
MLPVVFTYALAYGGAVVSLFNPYVGLLIYVCFAIIKPQSLWFWAVPPGNYSRVVAIALLAGWVLNGFGDWRFGRGGLVVAAAIGYLAWCIVSFASVVALDQDKAWEFTELTSKIILPVVVGATLIDSMRKLKQLAWVIALSGGYLAWQFNLSYLEYGPFNRLTTVGFAGMEEKSVAVGMTTTAGLAFFLGIQATRWWAKATGLALTALMIHVPLFTMTRGGMLAMVATAVVAFLLLRKRPVHYATFALMTLLGLLLAGREVREQFMTTFASQEMRDPSAQSRVDLWWGCCGVMAEHPFTGIGPRQWIPYWRARTGVYLEAHQTWLQLGAEIGIPGLLMFILFMGVCAFRLWPLARGRIPLPDPELCGIASGVISGLVGFWVASQFITLYYVEHPFFLDLMGIGVLKIVSQRQAGTWLPPGDNVGRASPRSRTAAAPAVGTEGGPPE